MSIHPDLTLRVDPDPGTRRHPAVINLLAHDPPTVERIEAFLSFNDFPLIQPGAATFAFRGEADRVGLVRFVHAGADRVAFRRLAGTDLWLLRLPVEDDGRFEYKLAVDREGSEDWILDPFNPARADDPFGKNSVCRTYGYERPEWSKPSDAPPGRVDPIRIRSEVFGETRHEQIYLPPGYDPARAHPLVVFHDGADFAHYADLLPCLDNLIGAGDIPPVVGALVQTGARTEEYARGRRHARYLVRELLPALDERYALSSDPRDRVLLGASLGAVASLSTAYRYRGLFGGLVLNSGSFIFNEHELTRRPHPVFRRVTRLVKAIRRAPPPSDTRAFVSTGRLEGLAGENRALAEFLQEHGLDVQFRSAWDGHHWHNWRNQLRDGLMWVLRPDPRRD